MNWFYALFYKEQGQTLNINRVINCFDSKLIAKIRQSKSDTEVRKLIKQNC